MIKKHIKKLFFLTITLILFLHFSSSSFSQTETPTPTTPPDNTQARQDLQDKINALQSQKQTLASSIEIIKNKIQLTEYQIESTKEQITSITLDIDTASKKISSLQGALDNSVGVLLNRIVATYEVGTIQPLQILLTAGNVSDFFTRLNYLKLAQAHDKKLIYDTQQAKVDYANQKNIFEDKKKQVLDLQVQLQAENNQLDQEKQAQQQLLAADEAQIAQYQAQLAALSSFARSRVGPGGQSVAHQDLSDSWGKYYNQRDANWGNNFIGLSNEQIWDVGCLLTSYAMVVTHFGGSVSPADVAANTGNFFGNTAYFLKPGPSANGHSANDVSYPSRDDLKNDIKSGNAVIAGLSYDGGPIADHWVVLRSVNDDGSFMINDPLYEGAMNVPLNDHYSGLTIVEARIYQ